MLNMHAAPATGGKVEKPRGKPTLNVWESTGLDRKLSDRGVKMRKNTAAMMESIYQDLLPHVEATTFPPFLPGKIRPLGICGL